MLGGETDLTGVIQRLVAQVNYFGMHTAAEVVAGTSMSLKRTTDGAGFRVSLDRVTLAFEGNPETSESVGSFSGARSETEYLQATFTIAGNDTKVQEGDVWTVSVNDKILSYTAPVLNDATAISSVDVSITDDDAVGVHIIESDGSTDVAEPSNTVLIGTGVVNDGGQAQLTTVVRVLDVDLDTIDASFDSLITVATRDSTVEGKFTLEISFVNVDDHADRAWGINVKTAPGEFKIVEVSAAEINTKMMATTSLSKVEALAGLFRDKIDELITEPVVTADRVEFVGSFGVAETGESDAHATVFEAQDLDGSAWNRNASGNIEQAETLPHLTVNATHDGTADFYQFTITEKMFGDSGTISAIFDVDDGYEATVPWYPSIRLHKARFDASGRLDGSDVIVDGTSLPTSFPGAEALFAYRYDDDGSDNWEAYLERTFDQSSAIYGEGTYFIEIGDYSTQAGFAREFIDDYSLHVSIEGHEVDGFVFAQAPVTDTEAAVQQLEPDGDIGKNFFTFEDPTVGNTGLTTPGLVTSAAPYVRIEGSGDGSADVYEFTISEDQLTPTPIPITDETVVSSASNIFYTKVTLSLTGRAVVGDTWIIGLRSNNIGSVSTGLPSYTVVPADIGADDAETLGRIALKLKTVIESSDRKFDVSVGTGVDSNRITISDLKGFNLVGQPVADDPTPGLTHKFNDAAEVIRLARIEDGSGDLVALESAKVTITEAAADETWLLTINGGAPVTAARQRYPKRRRCPVGSQSEHHRYDGRLRNR